MEVVVVMVVEGGEREGAEGVSAFVLQKKGACS